MKTKIISVTLILIILSALGCEKASKEISKDQMFEIVEKQNNLLAECFKSGDAQKLSEMYCDSAKLSPNGYDFVVGRENIKNFWAEDFKTSKLLEMNTNVMTVDGNEALIYETGKTTSKILYEDSVYVVTVKYINLWRKQADGTYKLDIDFWNKDMQK